MPILALPALRLSPATDYPRYYYYCVLNLISASASLSAIRRLADPSKMHMRVRCTSPAAPGRALHITAATIGCQLIICVPCVEMPGSS